MHVRVHTCTTSRAAGEPRDHKTRMFISCHAHGCAPMARVTFAETYVHQLRVRSYIEYRCNCLLEPVAKRLPFPFGEYTLLGSRILFHDYASISRLCTNESSVRTPEACDRSQRRLSRLYRSSDAFTTARRLGVLPLALLLSDLSRATSHEIAGVRNTGALTLLSAVSGKTLNRGV